MGDRKFTHGLHRRGDAAKIRETVAIQMKETSIQNRPKPVEPVDYETYVVKNKVLLHNDPQREMLTFPYDDFTLPSPAPPKKMRTMQSSVPQEATGMLGNLLVEECVRSYTDTCHMIQFKYQQYSGGYQQLPNIRKPSNLPDQVFEIDTEADEREYEDTISRSYSSASVNVRITKAGWLYKGPDSGKDNIISFTRQFKRRYFCVKQQADQTYSLEFYKDERKTEAKGVIFLDCAQEVVKNSKKGKHCFEVRLPDKAYLFAAENEAEMEDWIRTLDKVRTAAETLSLISIERSRDDVYTPTKDDKAIENLVHPELMKYAKESESMMHRARQDSRQNLFNVYASMARFIEDDWEDEIPAEVDVFPRQFGERFMLRLLDFRLKLQVNLADEGQSHKLCNPEPFFLTFALYDAKEGRKISEDFYLDLNEPEIEGMIPAEILHASDRLHTVEGRDTMPGLNGLAEKWLLSKNRQGIFSVIRRHSEIYLHVRIEKVLQSSISAAVEPYLKGADPKVASKVYRQMRQFCSHIGHHHQAFAWSARPLATSSHGPCELPIYRQESSKLSEEEIIKHLQDLRRPEKQGKWQTIPGVFKISLHSIKADQPLENTITSSYVPVKPFPQPPNNPPAIEIEEFVPEKGQLSNPYNSYCNNLYVYPLSLKYDSQKSFTKARNIACCIEVRDSDDDGAVPLRSIYSRLGTSAFTCVASTTVLHHSQTPDYLEEVKLCLPPVLHEKHHLLFRFYHVSCEGSKSSAKPISSGKRKDGIEMPVGFAWVPLLHSTGRVDVGEKILPVAVHLPPKYLSSHVAGRSGSAAEVKMVEGGKSLFKLKLLLNSTVYTKNQHLHAFFYHCQKMMSSPPSPTSDIEGLNKLKVFEQVSGATGVLEQQYLMNAVKSLHAVDVSTFIQFLPTILNLLFKLVATAVSEDVSMNACRVVIHIVSEVHEAEKLDMLQQYVKYVFRAEPAPKGSRQKTVHEELARSLTMILRPANADQLVITKFLNNSWFFFELLLKSMTQYLIDGERVKMPRNERFSGDYQYRIQTLLQTLTPYIVSKYREAPRETRNANFSVAYFVKMCFTLMDRGMVFQFIHQHLQNFSVIEHRTLHEYKFEFLRIVSSHEHFIPLCLPLMRKGMIKTYKDLKCDYTLSEEYRRTHYLTGLILQELKLALNEPKEVRRCAINVLRDQFAKHAFDDRYTHKSQQGRIAALYLPLISILLDNKSRLTKSDDKSPPIPAAPSKPASIANGDVGVSKSAGHTPVLKHRSMISLPVPQEAQTKRDSSVFDIIAGTKTHLGVEDLRTAIGGSSTSLASTASSTDTKTEGSVKDMKVDYRDKSHSRQHSSTSTLPGSSTTPSSPKVYQYQKLDNNEIKDLLICLLHILRYLPDDILLGWFNNSSEYDIIDFFSLLELCLEHFKYQGRKKIMTLSVIGDSSMGRKAATLPSHRRSAQVPTSDASLPHTLRSVSQYGDYPPEGIFHATTSSEADAMIRALSEANLATETGLIVLDILSVYTDKFKKDLEHRDGDNTLMCTVFDLYLSFLKTSQSETLQKHVFAVWRNFIRKFPTALFRGDATLCGNLCYEVLRCCNSRLSSTRKEACALLYNLMKANFEFNKRKTFTRVHLQVIISVAQLIGNVVTLNNNRFQESLALINSYASCDKAMVKTRFQHEVKDVTRRIKTVMMATAQMKEHEQDPEMLVDLQYSLACSYASTPELRKTWLDSMARIHTRYGNYSEAAHCHIHVAALVAEYLKKRGKIKSRSFPQGCTAFKHISSNVEKEESGIKDDSGMQDIQYSEETLVDVLEQAAQCLDKAERYEVLGDIYKLIVPVYEHARDFEKLAESYQMLAVACNKVVEVMQSGRRLLGKYFRVAFFGQTYFEVEDQKQYIYKEPKVTSLAEVCDRLQSLYEGKFGKDNVKLIMDSNQVDPDKLDNKYAYIQVTHVTPFFKEKELQRRLTEFERNNNINQFMYETPFTKVGKSRGEINEQFKRRTILLTSHAFPFVKKRIELIDRKEVVLSPIEVAIDEMTAKVMDMRDVVDLAMPDMKKLQLKLQGSVSAQVNAGPLIYAEAFLSENRVDKYPVERVDSLKAVFKEFISVCSDALDLNTKLITTEQKEYHESLKAGFTEIVNSLSKMLGETILANDTGAARRGSTMSVFSLVTTQGSSNA